MPRLPQARRRVAGVSLFAILVMLGVLYALRKIPPRSPQEGREGENPNGETRSPKE
jgi:hypothetical protein